MTTPLLAVAPTVFANARGRGVVAALVDTGVFARHPHLAAAPPTPFAVSIERAPEGLRVVEDGAPDGFGHGTACAALFHALAPEAALGVVRVTSASGGTDAERLARGLEEAERRGARLIATPLGTPRADETLRRTVAGLVERGVVLVAPLATPETWPAALPGVAASVVRLGVDCRLEGTHFAADGRPRPIPGREKNFVGPSFATVRVAAAIARSAEVTRGVLDLGHFKRMLALR
jgi:hypothetical protein